MQRVFRGIALATAVFGAAPAFPQATVRTSPGATQTARVVARADSLLAAGSVARAETLYYAVSRRNPRDPAARAALGKYLASRGAFHVGATLLEEAVVFGGDAAHLAHVRAPVLRAADEWMQLAQLAPSPLTPAELARARWLAVRPPVRGGADSVTVAFEPSSADGLGRVQLVIGSDTLAADIDPNIDELVIGDYTRFMSHVQVFAGTGGARLAAVDTVSIGGLVLTGVPARIDARLGPARARIGLILLAKLAPTVDAAAGVLTLRRDGRVGAQLGRRRVSVVFTFPGVSVARGDRLVPVASPAGRAVLAEARWTLDLRRGELVLEVDARRE